MKNRLDKTICDLWNISRTALAGQDTGRHARMIYIKSELNRTYQELIEGMTSKQVWFAIEDQINPNEMNTQQNVPNFETGAQTAPVNNLLLFVQTARNLSEERAKIFTDWVAYGSYGTAPLKWTIDAFLSRAIIQYFRELKSLVKLSQPERADFITCIQTQYFDWKEQNYGLRSVRVTYSNNDVIETSMAHGLTNEQINDYFSPGKVFNIGTGGADNMQTVVKCEILK